jgi:hypothetical protein
LLILALPVQGLAAASQAFCHSKKSETAQAMTLVSHVHKHESATTDSHQVNHADIKVSKLNHKCSNCTQCCAGFALAFFEQPRFVALQTESALVESLPMLHSSIALRGLERPPRTPSA